MTDPWIGTQIGEYHVDDLLGEGGMGKVYTATGPDGTRVALKLVKDDYARDETFRRRFYREARIAQTVKHPNVVPVLAPASTRASVHGAAVHRGALARPAPQARRSARRADRGPDLHRRGRRARGAVGGGHGPPRRQAGQHPARRQRDRLHHRLRPGQGHPGQHADAAGPGARLDGLHGPRADPRRAGHGGDRHLRARLRDVRVLCGRPPFADVQGMRILWAHLQDPPPDPASFAPT